MQKYRGKTLEEWRKYINEDKQVGIRATKYIIVLEELVEELQSKLHQPAVISTVCNSPCCKGIAKHEVKIPSEWYCEVCYKQTDL